MDLTNLLAQARAWMEHDPDPETSAELGELIALVEAGNSQSIQELSDRFDGRLSFGTAGLRGAQAAGPNRINRVVIAQTAAGIAQWLLDHSSPEEQTTIVIGYDGRKNSDIYARDSAEIFAGYGMRTYLMPYSVPTPVLAFAVKELRTSAGIMVTASHNPPQDNGYKVYMGGSSQDPYAGAQITSPTDNDIAVSIERAAEDLTWNTIPRGEYELVPEAIMDAYVAKTAALVPPPESQLTVVYSAMHGVGSEIFQRVLGKAGFQPVIHVPEQDLPDPLFPTVTFPNPEEPDALRLSRELAKEVHADLILAHDPDADRLAVAIPDESLPGGFRTLSGNEIGCLLGWWVTRKVTSGGRKKGTLAATIVSTPALVDVAHQYKLDFRWTLSGFKWVARVPHLIFGFEEALGYLVNPQTLRDKDGISAALAFLSLASELANAGSNVAHHLEDFSRNFGHHASTQVSHRAGHVSEISQLMDRLRKKPPKDFGGMSITTIDDFLNSIDGLPPANVLRWWLEDGSRVMVRPSGTEPKLKIYIDVVALHGNFAQRKLEANDKLHLLTEAAHKLLAS